MVLTLVKRFIQMKLAKIKTDKSEVKAIYDYGVFNELPDYSLQSDTHSECLQLVRLLDSYIKKATSAKEQVAW